MAALPSGRVKIGLNLSDDDVWFEFDPASYPGLHLLQRGTRVTATGKLGEAAVGFWLDEAEMSF
jgi:hypothetical protein